MGEVKESQEDCDGDEGVVSHSPRVPLLVLEEDDYNTNVEAQAGEGGDDNKDC